MSNIVTIENLTPGMVIVQIIKQNGPVKIRKSGLVTSEAMVQGLSEMGVQEVEIDPEQTVEIAPATTHHRTQTQALLRGEHDTTAKFDKSLNEQFNRSLFLPTVEGLPSAWKLYTKQVALFAVVILGGLCIGFSAATAKRWWPMLTAPAAAPTTASEASASKKDKSDDTSELVATQKSSEMPATSENQSEQTQPTDQTGTQSGSSNVPKDEAVDIVANTPSSSEAAIEPKTQPDIARSNKADENVAATQGDNSSDTLSSQDYEGKVLNESEAQSDVLVSPELMARFNAAVAALDSKAQDDTPAEEETKITVKDDLPRVDQLPVRLLTRLPTMNFSAHMYASRPADRWVRVNGRQIGEGDWIADRVQIVNIEAQRVVLSFEDEIFTMAALTDW
ncbi:general secretion pathway protein GspB [Alteromonas macleodii]|uniref:Type II secretion system protein B n=1 Tax=Alteromonas macleodii TaxID=28108 RepID=A0A6T9XX70_ALTMA|nr:general secretion pathway protein GspB [Alteromonas macleodii]CAB9492919.1 Type II secretion system protein B [Alteromonas macleodii]